MNQYYTEKQQTRYVDDAMRQARVQARKAQQTGGGIPSVKGIRESVVQPIQPAASSIPVQSAAPLTASAPSVPRAPSTPSVSTTPKVTSTPRAASIPRVTPTTPAVNSSVSGLSDLKGLTGSTGASGLLDSTSTRPQTGGYAQNANADPLYAGRPKITNDVWGTNAPAAYSPLQTPASAKASAPKTAQPNFTTSTAGAILKTQGTQAAPMPYAAATPTVTVNTAPISNRSRAAAEENTPNLALDARKLADMRSLYREFSPTLKTALEDEYKNDPAGLRVIRGELSADDWLKEKQDARAAVAAQRKVDSLKNSSVESTMRSGYGVRDYMTDMDGQLILLPDSGSNQQKRTYHYELDHDGNWIPMPPQEELRVYQRRATLLDPQSVRYPNRPPKDQNGKSVFTVEEWNDFQDRLLSEASRSSDYVLWKRTEELNNAKVSTITALLDLLDTAAMLTGSGISEGDSLALMLQKLGAAYVEGIDKPSMAMTANTQWYQNWQAALKECNTTAKLSDLRYFVKNDIAAIEFVQKQQKRLEGIQKQTDFGYDTPLKNEYFKQRLLQEIELSILINTVERKKARKSWRSNS